MSFSSRREKTLLSDPGLTIVPPGPGWTAFSITVVMLALILSGLVYWAGLLIGGAQTVAQKETRSGEGEQKLVLNRTLLARQYHDADPNLGVMDNFTRWLPHDTDGVIEPLWPWLASRLAARDHLLQESRISDQDRELFRKGKWMNAGIALGFLAALGLVAAKAFSPPAAVAVLLAGAFGALLPRAVLFLPDTLNYILVFLAWLCAIRLQFKNNIWMHGLFGVLTGLAWLTDSTAWIVVAAWFVASGCRWLRAACRRQETVLDESWTCRNHFLGLFALAIGWLAVCGPRCAVAMERWGNPLHTAQQKWMWADSAEEAGKWTRHDALKKEAGAAPSPDELPGLSHYRQTHSMSQAGERLMSGFQRVWGDFWALDDLDPIGKIVPWPRLLRYRGAFLLGAAVIFMTAWILALKRTRSVDREGLRLPSGSGTAAIFVAVAAAGYGLWYGWYRPIARDDGYLLVLYLPLFFSFVWGAERLMTIARMRGAPRWQWLGFQTLLWGLCAAIVLGAITSIRATNFHLWPDGAAPLLLFGATNWHRLRHGRGLT